MSNDLQVRSYLRGLVAGAYTRTTTTPGGVIVARRPKTVEMQKASAGEVVKFAADFHPSFRSYRTAGALWSDLVDELLANGTLVREENGALQHRNDKSNLQTIKLANVAAARRKATR